MKRLIVLAAAALMPAAYAQPKSAPEAPQPANKVIVTRGQTVATAVAAMAKAANAVAAVDPDINVNVSAATARLPLEQGLDTIAKANHAIWRKVYLPENEIPRLAGGAVDARRLKRIVASLDGVNMPNIGVVDPATGQMTVVSRDLEASPAMKEWAKTRKAVYLLYRQTESPAAAPGLLGDALPPGGLDALKAMTPEQRAQWMKDHGGVVVSSDMTPEQRAQALQSLPPEERARIEEKMNKAAQDGGKSMVIMQRQEVTQ
ncbi:MAG TPA: hypothetical protein VGM51_05060 [Armatimonadota bacterium]|jgi:hypothetical protein